VNQVIYLFKHFANHLFLSFLALQEKKHLNIFILEEQIFFHKEHTKTAVLNIFF